MSIFTKTTAKTPEEYIELIDEPRRSEIEKIHTFICETIPDLTPYIMSGMIAYGVYHYKYKSGVEGDWSIIALANQKNYISIYVAASTPDGVYIAERYKELLPEASISKSCIRFKRIEDIDWDILREIIQKADELHKKKK